MKTKIILLLMISALFAGCTQPDEPTVCTLDAKICPDGTAVGRVAPDCEFAPCPEPQPVGCPEDARVCPDGTVVVREGPDCEFAACPVETSAIVDANNEFALDLYRELRDSDGNMFYSPWSILSALAMTYEGARGPTAEEMREVLHLPEDEEVRRGSFKKIQDGINREDKEYELYTANALWPQQDYPFLDSYIDTIRTYYGGDVTALDYVSETEKSRQTINSWIEEKTNDKIKDLIPPGAVNALTRMVLTNAIYFKGTWVMEFDEEDTREENFHVSSEETVTAQMMRLTGDDARFNYAEDEDVQVLELPYDGEEVSMLVILPRENDLEDLEESLSAEDINQWRSDLQEQEVRVYLPKFRLETKYFLPQVLKNLNMVDAFDSEVADFSGMDGTTDLFISNVIHQAFVEVNEEGTEAAAATAVMVGITSVQEPTYKTFRADHPFIFLIQETETGNILFMGRVTDPS